MTTLTIRSGVPLSRDQIDQVRGAYRRLGTTRKVAVELGVGIETVAKYTRDVERSKLPALTDLTWQESAACVGYATDTFFPTGYSEREAIEDAKAICRACPVTAQCLEYARATSSVGIFGGKFINYDGRSRAAS